MFTGPGPMYMRDSTTAASIAAAGMAVGNVIDSSAAIAMPGVPRPGGLNPAIAEALNRIAGQESFSDDQRPALTSPTIEDYAVIYVFEPVVCGSGKDKHVNWRLLNDCKFPIKLDREFLTLDVSE
jgi:hypothetical protein